MQLDSISGPHNGQPVLVAGAPIADAAGALVLIHGRGAGAASILDLGEELARLAGRDDLALVAPQAASSVWYPQRFIAPEEQNEPWLSSAREAVARLLDQLEEAGLSRRKIVLAGFSQGACLASDTLARRPAAYAAGLIFSGGLIGPLNMTFSFHGSLEQTPVLIGCSDIDMHIPVERVHETAEALRVLEADVDLRIYEGMGHTVNEEELELAAAVIRDRL